MIVIKKVFIPVIILVVIAAVGYSLWNYTQGTINATKDELSVRSYFPDEKMKLVYDGGYENSGYTREIQIVEKDRVQILQKDTAINLAMVYQVADNKLRFVFSKEDADENGNYINEKNRDEILLQAPLVVGTTWSGEDGRTNTITGIDVDISTPSGSYKTIEVTRTGGEFEIKDYYAQDIGLVRNLFRSGGMDIKSELIKIEK